MTIRILRGVFYWEHEHSLNDFEIQEYPSYKEAMLHSLDKALAYFRSFEPVNTEYLDEARIQAATTVIKEVEADITKIKAGETPPYLAYSNHCSEYHMKVM